jgi:hypothetical protein
MTDETKTSRFKGSNAILNDPAVVPPTTSERFDNLEDTMAAVLASLIHTQVVTNVDRDEVKDLSKHAFLFMRNLPEYSTANNTMAPGGGPQTLEQDVPNSRQGSDVLDDVHFKRKARKINFAGVNAMIKGLFSTEELKKDVRDGI